MVSYNPDRNGVTDETTVLSALVIGAGFGGVTAGMMMLDGGVTDFRIVERNAGAGGTWWSNRYPGAEADVHCALYSWGFTRRAWARTHPGQAELQRYVEDAIDEKGLRPFCTFSVSVDELIWTDELQAYRARLSNGEVFYASVVICAAGLLSQPRYPNWPGYESFTGPKIHTGSWTDVDLDGKRVAVIGAGSSAAQVVAAIAPSVDHLYVFQREPGWVIPKQDKNFSAEEMAELGSESAFARRKRRAYYLYEVVRRQAFRRMLRPQTKVARQTREVAESYLNRMFSGRPELREALTPAYNVNGKRMIVSASYYPALLRDNVTLVPRAVERLTTDGVVGANGIETKVDVIILATGFDTTRALGPIEIVGRSGRTLDETWSVVPRAVMGISVPDFPNLFMIHGPSTHGGSIFLNMRAQARWVSTQSRRFGDRRSPPSRHDAGPSTSVPAGWTDSTRAPCGRKSTATTNLRTAP